MVSTRTKQATGVGVLLTIAIALITWGVNFLQNNTDQWYIGIAAAVLGLVMAVVDVYVLKGQESC